MPSPRPTGLIWGMAGRAEQKGFPRNFPSQRRKSVLYKSCLEWVLCVALFLKVLFQEASLCLIFLVQKGMRRERGVSGRGEVGGGAAGKLPGISLGKHSLLSVKPARSATTPLWLRAPPFLHTLRPPLWALPTAPRPLTLAWTVRWG